MTPCSIHEGCGNTSIKSLLSLTLYPPSQVCGKKTLLQSWFVRVSLLQSVKYTKQWYIHKLTAAMINYFKWYNCRQYTKVINFGAKYPKKNPRTGSKKYFLVKDKNCFLLYHLKYILHLNNLKLVNQESSKNFCLFNSISGSPLALLDPEGPE